MVKSSANHLLCLINNVLGISKLEAGKFELIGDDIKLDDVLVEVLNTVLPMANLMNGDLTISSQYGQGSEFVFTLQSDSIKIDEREIATVAA